MTFKLPIKDLLLTVKNDAENFESIVGQLQVIYRKGYLYVKNGVHMGVWNRLEDVPTGDCYLEHETKGEGGTHYYVRDRRTQDLWCVFHPTCRDRLVGTTSTVLNLRSAGTTVEPVMTWQQI